jgi:putative chitinase
MIDREKFYNKARVKPFVGILHQAQVEGCEVIFREWEKRGLENLRWLAYILGTTYHETAHTMQPIVEFGKGRGHGYGVPIHGHTYYGRGYVQLTWEYNYKKLGDILDLDLVNHPDWVLRPSIAVQVMFVGMIHGIFTGRKLATYFTTSYTDWVGARKIVNGLDRAEEIAAYSIDFHQALIHATMENGE